MARCQVGRPALFFMPTKKPTVADLARKSETEPASRHLYMLDESSLASSKQRRFAFAPEGFRLDRGYATNNPG